MYAQGYPRNPTHHGLSGPERGECWKLEDVASGISGGNPVGALVGLAHVGARLLIAPEVRGGYEPRYFLERGWVPWATYMGTGTLPK